MQRLSQYLIRGAARHNLQQLHQLNNQRTMLLINMQRRLMKQSAKAASTQSGNITEDFDSLLKKLAMEEDASANASLNAPSVIKQKDDVVYIADPSPEWRFWSPIKIGDSLSLTISLQKDQAIALLLNKYNAQAGDTFKSVASSKVTTQFGAVNGILGNQIKKSYDGQAKASAYEFDLSGPLQKTHMISRSLVTKQLFTGHTRLDLA